MRGLLRATLGTLVIGIGILLLVENFASEVRNRELLVSGLVGLAGIVFLISFAFSHRLWQLPLGCALATVGGLQMLFATGLDNVFTVIGGALVGSGGVFVGLYLNKSTQWGWLVPGYGLWVAGGTLLLVGLAPSPDWWVTSGTWSLAILFFLIYAGNRKAVWALTPAYILWALGAGTRLVFSTLSEAALATWGTWALALVFWVGYLRDDTRTGRLWVAGALTIAGALPLFFAPQLGFWLAIGVSAGVGLAWLATLIGRREQSQAS